MRFITINNLQVNLDKIPFYKAGDRCMVLAGSQVPQRFDEKKDQELVEALSRNPNHIRLTTRFNDLFFHSDHLVYFKDLGRSLLICYGEDRKTFTVHESAMIEKIRNFIQISNWQSDLPYSKEGEQQAEVVPTSETEGIPYAEMTSAQKAAYTRRMNKLKQESDQA